MNKIFEKQIREVFRYWLSDFKNYNNLNFTIMLRTISFIALAVIASGVIYSFRGNKESANDQLGV